MKGRDAAGQGAGASKLLALQDHLYRSAPYGDRVPNKTEQS